jgi:hypothetical protein
MATDTDVIYPITPKRNVTAVDPDSFAPSAHADGVPRLVAA